ncbi:MAG: hypothetical protein RLZZ207_1222 [Bacteroidota bacterium]
MAYNAKIRIMKTLTLKLPLLLFKGIKENAAEKGISMESYIIEALEIHHRTQNRKKLAKAFSRASLLVRESSMETNAEWDQLLDD